MSRTQKKSAGGSKSGTHDVFDILRQDHKNVRTMLHDIMDGEQRDDEKFTEIESELHVHMGAEEKHLYPELENEEETRDLALEAYEEHSVAKAMMEKVRAGDIEEDVWLARIKVLTDILEHHIEEEEGQIFKKAKTLLDKGRQEEIKRLVEEEKAAAKGQEGAIAEPEKSEEPPEEERPA